MLNLVIRSNLINLSLKTDWHIYRNINTTSCLFAARKGIRLQRAREALARSKQRKAERIIKVPWIHPKFRVDKNLTSIIKKRYTDIGKNELPNDNVYFLDNLKEINYSIEEAIDLHREVLDKTMLNEPDALFFARIELNLRLKKKTKFLKGAHGVFLYPNDYLFKKSTRVVAICRNDDEAEECRKIGATLSGQKDILKLIKTKELKEVDYDYIVCHNDLLLQLAESRKFLGDRFPGPYLNNFGGDIIKLVNRFVNGLNYKFESDIVEQDYGWLETHFGRATMSNEQLKENLIGLLKEVQKHKPEDTKHPFITRVLIIAKPNDEQFKIRHWEYLGLEDPYSFEVEQYEKELKEKEEEKRKAAKKKKKRK